ncbi:fimbria/pilus outer membrane usher protein [Bradyrhizobium sp. LHD-71]|uniref:fimbria/pilus outer membrane usher protein n=1 Tax=Bradyrhizobium sp. LHD-71 TaxID=3072141 RepID=UPI00280C4EFE|nr:fimbria/pilus outer membrane usher protein [Bradyrhizobium sp. LHD-71]MDQ8729442.1 fimbria/pilus outer membrane usher protein [Bradyrhizobium sp. LHD-71]
MRRPQCKAASEVVLLLVGLAASERAQAQGLMDIPPPAPSTVVSTKTAGDLQLNVSVNDTPINLIGSFRRLPDGSIAAAPEELNELGLLPAKGRPGPDGLIRLDTLPGVTYRVDDAMQVIWINAPDAVRRPRVINLRPHDDHAPEAQRSFGGIINYTLFAASDGDFWRDIKAFQGVSGAFEGRLFSPYGTFNQSFIGSTASGELGGFTRLDTTWSYSSPQDLITYRAGDMISGGLSWTRSVRMGGIQIQRNFGLRPDLVTMPIPVLSGSAAVPSTLDVYTQNVRTFSGAVPAGPYEVTNLPVATGGGTARVVLRDALGRETVTTLPFYVSSQLLQEGLTDFSAELGFARRFYGIASNGYDGRPVASGSMRYGLTDWLTLEGHAEGGAGLLNGGVGASFALGSRGVASLAVAGSRLNGRAGGLVNAAIELSLGQLSLYARTQRTFGEYDDIASVTAPAFDPWLNHDLNVFSAKVPKVLDQISVGMPLPFDRSNLNLSYTQLESAWGDRDRIVGLSYSRGFGRNATFYATAFKSLDDRDGFGVFAGISFPLGDDITLSGGVQNGPNGTSAVVDAIKSERPEVGSYGWRVRDAEGGTTDRSAAASYRGSFGRVEAGVQQFENSVRATAQFGGSIAFAGGGVFFGNRIDDAFAVVDAGAPDVLVRYENRPVGKTNGRGLILVPYLNSYQKNKISIDSEKLPVDAEIPTTDKVVVPADRNGVVVKFGVEQTSEAALITFVDASRKPIDVGSQGILEGSDEGFVVGYDGQSYLRDLNAHNAVRIGLAGGNTCRAEFDYSRQPGEQVAIKDVVCQ